MGRHAVRRTLGLPLLVAAVAGCDPNWEEPLPVEMAARQESGTLELWTGTPCEGVTEVEFLFHAGSADPTTVVYRARKPQTVERWLYDSPPRTFRRTPSSPEVAWEDFDDVLVRMDGPGGQRSVVVDLPEIRETEDGDYLVGSEWREESEVLAGDGEDYGLVCSPGPE